MLKGHVGVPLQVPFIDGVPAGKGMALADVDAGGHGGHLVELQLPGVQQAADHLLRQLRQEDDAHVGPVIVHVVDDSVHAGLLDGEVEAAGPGGVQHPQEGVLGEGIPLGGDGEAGRGRRIPGFV